VGFLVIKMDSACPEKDVTEILSDSTKVAPGVNFRRTSGVRSKTPHERYYFSLMRAPCGRQR